MPDCHARGAQHDAILTAASRADHRVEQRRLTDGDCAAAREGMIVRMADHFPRQECWEAVTQWGDTDHAERRLVRCSQRLASGESSRLAYFTVGASSTAEVTACSTVMVCPAARAGRGHLLDGRPGS